MFWEWQEGENQQRPRRPLAVGAPHPFERDHAGARYPFSEYPENVAAWVAELTALPASPDLDPWMFRHPDGRRWIGFRAGTYLVDRAMAATGQSSADLVAAPTACVVELAGVKSAEPPVGSGRGTTSAQAVVPQGAHSAPRRTRGGAKGSPLAAAGGLGRSPNRLPGVPMEQVVGRSTGKLDALSLA